MTLDEALKLKLQGSSPDNGTIRPGGFSGGSELEMVPHLHYVDGELKLNWFEERNSWSDFGHFLAIPR